MFVASYEDVVRRDQPAHWWRLRTSSNGGLLPSMTGGGQTAVGYSYLQNSVNHVPLGATGLPGATSGTSSYLTGDTGTNANEDGWYANSLGFNTGAAYIALELWVKPRAAFTANRTYALFVRTNNSNSTIGLTVSGAGKLQFYNPGYLNIVSNEMLIVNQWNHCVVNVFQGANSPTELYLNGQRTITTSPYATNVNDSLKQLSIGRPDFQTMYAPPANIAEAAVYEYQLTPEQVIDHYEIGLNGTRRRFPLLSINSSLLTPKVTATPTAFGTTSGMATPTVTNVATTAQTALSATVGTTAPTVSDAVVVAPSALEQTTTLVAPTVTLVQPQPAFAGMVDLPSANTYQDTVARDQPSHWWRGPNLVDWGNR